MELFVTFVAVLAIAAFIIWKTSSDDDTHGGVGGIGVGTDRPHTQLK